MLRFQATEAMANKDWHSACQYYQRLYRTDSSSLKTKYEYAEASRLNFDVDVALMLYMRVAGPDNGVKYPLSYYWLGQLSKHKEKYKEAKAWFERFKKLNLPKEDYGYYLNKTDIEIAACDLARTLIKNPLKIPVEHLSPSVNTKASEYAAFEKDSTLYFSSLKTIEKKDEPPVITYNKIYKADYKNKKWLKIKALDTMINKPLYHVANTCFTPDYSRMVLSRCQAINATEFRCNLYESLSFSNRFQDAKKISAPINLNGSSSSQGNFGVIDGKTILFFASDRVGGQGGMDIWYSVRSDSGTYSTPVNAGSHVNTPDDDVTPWFVSDSATLYFSSTYHAGMGGFDIFKSKFVNGSFETVQNVGYPINSSYNDIYFSINKAATKVYVSSNRVGSYFEGKLNCCNDIFSFLVDTVKKKAPVIIPPAPPIDTVKYAKEELKLLVPLTLYFNNDEPEPKTKSITTTKNYETTYQEYKHVEERYITEFTRGLNGEAKDVAATAVRNFFSDSVDVGLDNLHRFADMLKKVLAKGETVRITFKGYCSPLASTDYNVNLAKRRIVSLRNYFMEAYNGYFVHYLNNAAVGEGKLIFEDVEVGELPVSKTSDDLKDKRNSVYSPSAASERKIQILAVSFQ